MTIDKELQLLKRIAREHQAALRYVLCDPRASDEALRGHIMAALEYLAQLDADAEDEAGHLR